MSRGQAVGDGFHPSTASLMPSRDVVHLHLLRHGEVERFGEREARGHLDTPLSASGVEQHVRLARWLVQHERPDVVFTSDLSRCTDLAARVGGLAGVPVIETPALREQDMGRWEGRSWDQLSRQDGAAVTAWWNDYAGARPPGGESLEELSARVLGWWAGEVQRLAGQRVVVCTHVGVIRAWLCALLGVPLDQALRFAPPAASHSAVLLAEAGAVIQGFGERPWLVSVEAEAEAEADALPAVAVGVATGLVPGGPAVLGEDLRTYRTEGPLRIALCGSAGTGKSTLAARLAEHLDLPHLDETIRERIRGGLDMHAMDAAGYRAFMAELWEEQRAREAAATEGFVTDRSPIDYAAFWIHYQLVHDREATAAWMSRVLEALPDYSAIVLLPWGVLPLEHDGVRSTNRWTQFQFQALAEGLATRHVPGEQLLVVPPIVDLEARVGMVLRGVGRASV